MKPDPDSRSDAGGATDHECDKAPTSDKHDRPDTPDTSEEQAEGDALVDEMSEDSFPGSDPPSTWAGGGTA